MTSFGEKFLSFKIQIRLEFPLFISILMSCFQMYIGTKELNATLIVFHLSKAVHLPQFIRIRGTFSPSFLLMLCLSHDVDYLSYFSIHFFYSFSEFGGWVQRPTSCLKVMYKTRKVVLSHKQH